MSYPPPLPPDTRENDTPMADAHANDHNAVVNALEDVVGVLGSQPQGQYAGSMQDRLAWLAYQPGTALTATVSPAPDKIVLHCGTVDALIATSAAITLGVPLAAVTVTGLITASGGVAATGAVNVTGSIGATGRITGNDFVTTGPYYLNPGGTALLHDSGGSNARLQGANVELRNNNGGYAQLQPLSFYVVPATSGLNWNERPLVISGNPYGAIGFNSVAISKAGAIQFFTSAVASAGFHFVNTLNSAYLSCHAFKFVEASPPGMLREAVEWDGNGLNACRALRGQVLRSVVDTSTDGGEPVEGRATLGFLPAHVRALLPELVDDDEDGYPIGIAYSGFIPVLVDAIRNLDHRLDILERELEQQP